MRSKSLHTVCEEANCPNIGECWERGTATFMILGDVCTRRCGFCNVKSGVPDLVDRAEPLRVAHAVKQMGLRHCVVTSVDRDDLPDGGAGVFAETIRAIRKRAPGCAVEVLTPDFRGQEMPLARVHRRAARRLQPQRRDRAAPVSEGAPRLRLHALLPRAAERQAHGLRGRHEVRADGRPRRDAWTRCSRRSRCCASTRCRCSRSGQYLRPSENHLPLVRYWTPGRVRRAGARGVRDGLRVRRLRAAGAQQLPRGRAGARPPRFCITCERRADRHRPLTSRVARAVQNPADRLSRLPVPADTERSGPPGAKSTIG